MDTEIFIEKALAVHGDRFNYERTVHPGTRHCKVTIICPVHGEFEQRADAHLQGNGCKHCQDDTRRMSTKDFVRKARKVHGDRFDYSQVEYTGSHNSVIIVCPIHGPFEQKAYLHIQDRGCMDCSRMNHPDGYTYQLFKKKPELAESIGVFYIVEYKFPDEEFIKIGITQFNAYTRHKNHWKNVTILSETPMKMKDAFHQEQVMLHRGDLQPFKYTPTNLRTGITECFTLEAKNLLF